MNGSGLLVPSIFDGFPEIRCAVSTNGGGVSPAPYGMNLSYHVGDDRANVDRNRRLFFEQARVREDRVAVPGQCHSARVLAVNAPGFYEATDGLLTSRTDLWLTVTIADCVPVFLYDPLVRAIAAIHAGWRGSAARIVADGVSLMQSEFGTHPADLVASIGPSAGPCCYEVGADVAARFGGATVIRKGATLFLDLKAEVRTQLLEKGVKAERIEQSPSCTICTPGRFHSYRRDGARSGRMMGVIGLAKSER